MYPVRSSEQLLQQQGEGSAYIYNPADFSALNHFIMANKADKMAKEKALADRDADLEEKLKYNPKAIHAPYQQEQQQKYNALLNMKANLLRNHVYDPSHPDRIAYENAKNELEQDVAKSNDIMNTYQNVSGQIQKDKYLKQDQAQRAANDVLHDESGVSRLPIREVNPQAMADVVNDPQHFNLQAYSGDFAKETPEMVRSYLHNERLMGGQRTNEDIVKSKFHLYDDKGNLVKDEQGNPVINITPESKQLFYNKDPRAKAAVNYEVNRQNEEIAAYNALPENRYNQKPLVTEDDVLRQNISPYAYSNANKNVGAFVRPNQNNGGGGLSDEERAIARHKSLTGILNGDGAEIGNLEGGTIDGRKIDNARFIKNDVTKSIHVGKATNPETGEKTGKATDIEVPKYEVEFTLTDKKGQPKKIKIGANTKAELYYQLNNVYNTSPGQYKIAKEALDKNRGNNPIEEEEEDVLNLNKEEDPLQLR